MNYSHSYHAGNFADVVKHTVLVYLIEYLKKKPTPFCYIDSHAGAGLYDLQSEAALKTNEAEQGVQRLLQSGKGLSLYLQLLKTVGSAACERQVSYPGSPLIALHLLRSTDSLILNELHPDAHYLLKKAIGYDERVHIHQRDAYEFLPAVLPPKITRGLLLIDPPFENPDEMRFVSVALEKCLQRFAQGIYVLWMPITGRNSNPLHTLRTVFSKYKTWAFEFIIDEVKSMESGLVGCAMAIVNPPWQLEAALMPALKELWQIFSVKKTGRLTFHTKERF